MRVFAEERCAGRGEARPEARLSFLRAGARTVIETAFAESPLRLLTPKNHGRAAWTYTSTLGGGMVDGDAIRLRVHVREGAAAVLASQGQNRIYRSARGCRSELAVDVADGAFFALLPDATVCFAGAAYEQKTELRLERAGAAILVDVLSCGRAARGERWAFRRYSGELSLRLGDRLVAAERLLLDPAHGALGERLGRFDSLCTIVLAGEALLEQRAAIARRIEAMPLRPRAARIEQSNDLGGALLLRIAATSVEDATRAVRDHLHFLPELLGDDPWARRP